MRFSRHQGSEAFPEEMLNWSWKDGDAVLQPATAVESQLVRKRTHLRPQTFWGRIEASRHFESSMGGLIVLNCITMGLQAHAQVNNIQDPSLDLFLSVAEHVFTTSFTMEVLLRFVVHGFKAFTLHTSEGRGNFVDALLIFLTGTLLVWIIPVLAYTVKLKVSGDSLRTLTVLRAVRLVRLLRVFHRVHLFREAWMLIRGLKDSTRTLFWTVIVICLVTYVYSIFGLVTMVSELHSVRRSLVDFEEIDKMTEVLEYVGGLGSLMYTLIQILTQDSFHHFTRDILYFVPWSWVYFYGYIAVACFVLMNLVTAIIVENALSTSNHDQENKAMDMERKKDRELKELKKLFSEMDADESGTLCWDEFRDSFEDPVMSRKWMLLDFQPRDCKELFDLLDNGDGEIETEEFFEGLTKIKGTAQAKDVLWLQKNIFKLQDSLETVFPEIVKLPASRYTDMRNDPSGAASATASATGLASLASF